MGVIVRISALILICMVAYKCQKTEYVPESQSDDEDELGWIGENTEGENLEDRASTFKITQVVTTDSLPLISPLTNKKQKYAKRQIVKTTAKTRFWIRGIGFGLRSDSSDVKCYIKKILQPSVDIISWDSTQVVIDYPVLIDTATQNKTFSIQFKIFVAGKVGRTNISRSRSRSCISSKQAALYIITVPTTYSDITTSYIPIVGDILKNVDGTITTVKQFTYYNTTVGGIVYTTETCPTCAWKPYTYQYSGGHFNGHIGNTNGTSTFTKYSR